MSGHNKWSQIKRKKGATDAARSKVFGKLGRMIAVEAKKCNGDESEPGLRAAIEKARSENMPKDTIDRAIKKASELKGDMSAQIYEIYGPGGVGIMVTALTDNPNRTTPEIRHLMDKNGANVGAAGSVTWNFTKNPETGDWEPNSTIDLSDEDLEKLSVLFDLLENHDDVQGVFTNAS